MEVTIAVAATGTLSDAVVGEEVALMADLPMVAAAVDTEVLMRTNILTY